MPAPIGAGAAESSLARPTVSRVLRRPLVAIAVVFALTRVLGGVLAASPGIYDKSYIDASFEIGNYHLVADRIATGDRPYQDFDLEYPPGELPFVLLADKLPPLPYQTAFVLICVAVDGLGLAALYRLARRTGNWWGVLLWLLLVPALGPLVYSRTDIFVATAIAWAVERAHAGRFTASGGWLGFGAAVKLVPVLLLPAVLVASGRNTRRRVAAGFIAIVVVATLPFVRQIGGIWIDVIRYHADRGVLGESIWGSLLVTWRQMRGAGSGYVFEFGSWDVVGGAAGALERLSSVASLSVLAGSAAASWVIARTNDVARLAVLMTATLILLVVSGRVLSPQYMAWLIGAVSVGLCFAPRELRVTAWLIALATVLTTIGFPFLWFDLRRDDPVALAVLVARNLALAAAGSSAARAVFGASGSGPFGRDRQPVQATVTRSTKS